MLLELHTATLQPLHFKPGYVLEVGLASLICWSLSCFCNFSIAANSKSLCLDMHCDVNCAMDHVIRFTRPSSSFFAYSK